MASEIKNEDSTKPKPKNTIANPDGTSTFTHDSVSDTGTVRPKTIIKEVPAAAPDGPTPQQIADQQQENFNASIGFQMEQAASRDKNISEALAAINGIFANRGDFYDSYRDDVFDLNKREVNDQYDKSSSNMLADLARRGLTGGSYDVSANKQLADTKNSGLLRAQNYADTSRSNLEASDNNVRNSLYGMAASGAIGSSIGALGQQQLAQSAPQAAQDPGIGALFSQYAQPVLNNVAGQLGQASGVKNYRPAYSGGGSSYQGSVT